MKKLQVVMVVVEARSGMALTLAQSGGPVPILTSNL